MTPDYRIALRPVEHGVLDDVVVKDVEMFRMKDMGDGWWICCYLNGEDQGDRLCIFIDHLTGETTITEQPTGVTYENGSL